MKINFNDEKLGAEAEEAVKYLEKSTASMNIISSDIKSVEKVFQLNYLEFDIEVVDEVSKEGVRWDATTQRLVYVGDDQCRPVIEMPFKIRKRLYVAKMFTKLFEEATKSIKQHLSEKEIVENDNKNNA